MNGQTAQEIAQEILAAEFPPEEQKIDSRSVADSILQEEFGEEYIPQARAVTPLPVTKPEREPYYEYPTREEILAAPGEPKIPETPTGWIDLPKFHMSREDIELEELTEEQKRKWRELGRTIMDSAYKFTDAVTLGTFKEIFEELDKRNWPDSLTRELIGEAAHFAGFLVGPAKIAKIPVKAGVRLMGKVVKNPKLLGLLGHAAESAIGLGGAMALSDITNIKEAPERFLQGMLTGAVFGGTSFVHMAKHPVISQILRQGGSRLISSWAGLYEDPRKLADWKSMSEEERAGKLFEEILYTWFSRQGVKPGDITKIGKQIRADIEATQGMKEAEARRALQEKAETYKEYIEAEPPPTVEIPAEAGLVEAPPLGEKTRIEVRQEPDKVVIEIPQKPAEAPKAEVKPEPKAEASKPEIKSEVKPETEAEKGADRILEKYAPRPKAEKAEAKPVAEPKPKPPREYPPGWPKDAPQIWRDVWEATGGKGIRPFAKDATGKSPEIEEYKSHVPKPLRRRNKEAFPPDEVADMLGLEDSHELYRRFDVERKVPTEKQKAEEEREYVEAKAKEHEELLPEKEKQKITAKEPEEPKPFKSTLDENLEEILLKAGINPARGVEGPSGETVSAGDFYNEALRNFRGKSKEDMIKFFANRKKVAKKFGQFEHEIRGEEGRMPITKEGIEVEFPEREDVVRREAREREEAEAVFMAGKETVKEVVEPILKNERERKVLNEWAKEPDNKETTLRKLSEKTGVPYRTIGDWINKWSKELDKKGVEVREKFEAKKGQALEELFRERARIRREEGGDEPKAGLGIRKAKKVEAKEARDYEWGPEEVERRYKKAFGIPKPKLYEKVMHQAQVFWHRWTREFEHLPRTRQFSEIRRRLIQLNKQRALTTESTGEYLGTLLRNLTDGEKNVFFRREYLYNEWENFAKGYELRHGWEPETLSQEKAKIDAEVAKHPDVQEAIRNREDFWDALHKDYVYWMDQIGKDVADRFRRKHYFRQQVLSHTDDTLQLISRGRRLRKPIPRSHLKGRVREGVSEERYDYNTNFIESEAEVVRQILYDIEVAKTLKVAEKSDRSAEFKKIAKEKGYDDWRKAIPEGYEWWQPEPGNIFYLHQSIPERIALQVFEKNLGQIVPEQILNEVRTSINMGSERAGWAIPTELANTLSDLTTGARNRWLKPISKATKGWKIWAITSPRRYFKFNVRNLTGDAEHLAVGNPRAFKKVLKAFKELWDHFVSKKPMTDDLREFYKMGAFQSTLLEQEIPRLNNFKDLFFDKKGKLKEDINLIKKGWNGYWGAVKGSTNMREQILRYAAYKDYLEQMRTDPNGMPKNWGASLPEEVMGLPRIEQRAFKMSNDLLGAYDEVSVYGQALRQFIYPFWSWKEVNFRIYKRLVQNALRDPNKAKAVGNALLKPAVGTGFAAGRTAVALGRFAIKALGFSAMIQAWNYGLFRDEEEAAPDYIKYRPHIILGKDKNGDVQYFSRIGALGDLLEWFGLDAAPLLVKDYMEGNMTLKEIVKHAANSFLNQSVQGINPLYKGPIELLLKKRMFPEVTNPRAIRDTWQHIARELALEDEFNALFGKPSRPYKETLPKFFMYKLDPDEAAYRDTYDRVQEFRKDLGLVGSGFNDSPRTKPLYDMKLAHRFGDKKAEQKAMTEYINWHVIEHNLTGKPKDEVLKSIDKGISQSLKNMHPLSNLTEYQRNAFLAGLNKEEKEGLLRAVKFYVEVLWQPTEVMKYEP